MALTTKKPKIPNVWWRNGWAWGRVHYQGRPVRQPLETQDPKLARKRVKTWLDGLKGTKWGEKPRRSYDEAADRFIEEHLPRLKPRGAERYLQSLKVLTDFFEGHMLDQITSSLLSDFEQRRRRQSVSSGTILQ